MILFLYLEILYHILHNIQISLHLAGASVMWKFMQQTSVLRSIIEAEYIVASMTSDELVWVAKLLQNTKLLKDKAVMI